MLEAVESGFDAHSGRIEEAYRSSREALDERASRDLRHLEAERAEIERIRRDGDAVFEAERAELNARIETLNETVEGLESDGQGTAAIIESYREAYEHVLAELRTAWVPVSRTRCRDANPRRKPWKPPPVPTATAPVKIRRRSSASTTPIVASSPRYGMRSRSARRRCYGKRIRSVHGCMRKIEGLERAERDLAPLAEQYATLEDDYDRVQGELNRRIEIYTNGVAPRTTMTCNGKNSPRSRMRSPSTGNRSKIIANRRPASLSSS